MSIHPPIPAYIPLPIYASNHPFISPSIHPSPSNLSFYHLLIHFPSIHSSVIYSSSFFLFNHLTNHHSSSTHLSIHPSVHSNIPPSAHPKFIIYLSFQSPPIIYPSISPSIPASIYPTFDLVVRSTFHSSIHHFIHYFIYSSTHLPIYLLIYFPFIHPTIILLPLCIHSSTYPFIHPSTDSSILPSSNYLSINPCISLSICIKYPQIHPTIYTCSFTHSFTHSPSFYPFFISHTLSFTTHPMILTYKHPSSFHTQIYPPIHLSIPPHPVHGYFCNIYLPVHS